MIRAVTITFDVDSESGDVTNVKASVEGEVKKRTTTRKKSEVKSEYADIPYVKREENKLVFNDKAQEVLGVEAGDRIIFKLEKDGKKFVPVIGSSESWDEESGNKLAKAGSIVFKGKQNDLLAEFGTEFKLDEFKTGLYILTSLGGENFEKIVEEAEKVEPVLIIESDDEIDLDELEFKL